MRKLLRLRDSVKQVSEFLDEKQWYENIPEARGAVSATQEAEIMLHILSLIREKVGSASFTNKVKDKFVNEVSERLGSLNNEQLIVALQVMSNLTVREFENVVRLLSVGKQNKSILNTLTLIMNKPDSGGDSSEMITQKVSQVSSTSQEQTGDITYPLRVLDVAYELLRGEDDDS